MDTYEKSVENEILIYFSEKIKGLIKEMTFGSTGSIEEIRIRADKPIVILGSCGEIIQGSNEIISREDICGIFEAMCENSIYAVQEELKNGFITIKGGHRIGVAGKTVCEGKNIRNIKYFSGLNIRVSREVRGVSDGIMRYIINKNRVLHTMIISPPQCGKTTLLRDISRNLGNGIADIGFKGVKVGIVDERSEIAACFKGVPQNDVGLRTDVLDCCPKSSGMIMLLRSMSPEVIITDELGSREDADAVMQALNAGVKVITTAHGSSIEEVKKRREISELIENKVFERLIILSSRYGPGTVEDIFDAATMKSMWGSELRRDKGEKE